MAVANTDRLKDIVARKLAADGAAQRAKRAGGDGKSAEPMPWTDAVLKFGKDLKVLHAIVIEQNDILLPAAIELQVMDLDVKDVVLKAEIDVRLMVDGRHVPTWMTFILNGRTGNVGARIAATGPNVRFPTQRIDRTAKEFYEAIVIDFLSHAFPARSFTTMPLQ